MANPTKLWSDLTDSEFTTIAAPVPSPSLVETDTLVLLLSEDRIQGNAKFIAKVDGEQLSGPVTVRASHSIGVSQSFTFTGMWPAGAHDLEIDLVNSRGDNNLYLDQVTYNGASYLTFPAALPVSTGGIHIQLGDLTN